MACTCWQRNVPLVAIAILAAIFSFSQSRAATDQELTDAFELADANGDGYIEIDEYAAYMVSLFATRDQNRDGYLTPDELPDIDAERFATFDRNSDGKVSLGEGVGGKVVDFFDADTSRDGVMSLPELLAMERRLQSQ